MYESKPFERKMKLIGLMKGKVQFANSDGEGEDRDSCPQTDEHEDEWVALEETFDAVECGFSDTEQVAI